MGEIHGDVLSAVAAWRHKQADDETLLVMRYASPRAVVITATAAP